MGSFESSGGYFSGTELGTSTNEQGLPVTPGIGPERTSIESDELEGLAEDRVVAQGYLLCLKNVSGVRQWRRRWVVLRGRSLTLYKNFEVLLRRIPLQYLPYEISSPSLLLLSPPFCLPPLPPTDSRNINPCA